MCINLLVKQTRPNSLNWTQCNKLIVPNVFFLSDFSCDVVRYLLKQAYSSSTSDLPNNISFVCELKDLLNLLKVELFVADSYEEDFDDDDVPNEDMFVDDLVENEKNLDDNGFVENYSQIDVTEFKIEPNFPGNVKFKKQRQLNNR